MHPVICTGLGVAAFLLGFFLHKLLVNKEIGGAKKESRRILGEARREAEALKKEAVLEGRDLVSREKAAQAEENQRIRQELEERERRLVRMEERLGRQGENLDRREATLEAQRTDLSEKEQALLAKHQRVNRLMEEQNRLLEKHAGLTREEARKVLVANLEEEAQLEAGRLTRKILEQAERDAEDRANWILSTAIQRCSANHVMENCVSVVNLPSDDMKGRIIGREGRNIRSFEGATGVDVIIDDTPEAIVLSCFDPVRREVARQAMEKLIADGRIHPGRIESVVEKVGEEMEKQTKKLGNELCMEANVSGLHPQLIRHLGRLRYRTSYGQNMYQHSLEVAHISGLIASELKLDASVARRAGVLHDIGKATDQEVEGSHAEVGMELARRFDESAVVCNAVGAHHEEVEPESLYAVIVQAADAVSGARPGARRETLERYVRRLHRLESLADGFDGVSKSYAIQAGRELRIAVRPESVNDSGAADLARMVARRIERDMEYPGQIKVTVIREIRAAETAR